MPLVPPPSPNPVAQTTLGMAVLVALLAGLGTALMSGLLTPGVAPAIFLSLIAPTPILIAGFGWHPLVAALGGIVAVLLVNLSVGTPAALVIGAMMALPAFGVAAYAARAFGAPAGRPERDGIELGRIFLGLVVFIALAGVVAVLLLEADYATLELRIRKAVELAFEAMGLERIFATADRDALGRLIDLIAAIILPVSALVSIVTMVLSGALGLQIAARAARLAFPRPDFRRFRLPGGALILIAGAFFVAIGSGFLGLLGEIAALGLALGYMLQGLAVLHARTIGIRGRGAILAIVWAAILIFSFPALIFIGLGMADHLADFRRGRL